MSSRKNASNNLHVFLISVYVCMLVFMCVSMGARVPQHRCGGRRLALAISLHLPPFLMQGLLLATASTSQAGWPSSLQASSRVYLPAHHRNVGITNTLLCPALCVGPGDSSSSPRTWKASALPTEPSPQILDCIFFLRHIYQLGY